MAYIGKTPTVGNFQVCDAISVVNNQAAYTMQVGSVNVLPESANHMIVSLNGVIQKPNSSYTVAGAVITFSSALVTGDVINFIQILGSVLDLGVPSDDTVSTVKLQNDSVTTDKLANSINSAITANTAKTGITSSQASAIIANTAKVTNATHSGEVTGATALTIADNIVDEANLKVSNSPTNGYNLVARSGNTGGMTWEAAAGGNTPGFSAYKSSNQSASDNSYTLVTLDTEIYDSDGKFASNRFTPTVAGYYHCFGAVFVDGASDTLNDQVVSIYKNGSSYLYHEWDDDGDQIDKQSLYVAGTLYLDTDDYIELYAKVNTGSGGAVFKGSSSIHLQTHMGAFKVA